MEKTQHKSTAKVLLVALFTVVMALAMIFAILPATTLTAHAVGSTIEIDTNQEQTTYTLDGVTVTVADKGDGDGALVSVYNSMTITITGNVVIYKINVI